MTTTARKPTRYEEANLDSAKRFLAETQDFTLRVLHDDGLYKHLRFRSDKTGFYWFDLITWPGHLTFRGDAGCFTFARVEDMLDFFRSATGRTMVDPHRINPSYWGEKVQGTLTNGRDAVKKYDKDELVHWMRERATEHANDEGWPDTVREGMLAGITHWATWDLYDDRNHDLEEARCFEFKLREGDAPVRPGDPDTHRVWSWKPDYDSLIEADFAVYDWSFLWACHAIVWGIEQYDEHRAQAAAAKIKHLLGDE